MSYIQIQFRRGLSTEWTSANPILADGEFALETDTKQFKIGDGVANWNSISYGGIQGPPGTFSSIVNVDMSFNNKIYVGSDVSLGANLYGVGNVRIASTTASTSITTGALTVAGGIGVGGNIYVGGPIIPSYLPSVLTTNTMIGFTDASSSSVAVSNGSTRPTTDIVIWSFPPGVWLVNYTYGYSYPNDHNTAISISTSATNPDANYGIQFFGIAGTFTSGSITHVLNVSSTKTYYFNASLASGTTGGAVTNVLCNVRRTRIA